MKRNLFAFALLAVGGLFAVACDDTASKVSCSSDAQCVKAAGDLIYWNLDFSTATLGSNGLPVCCQGTCVLPAYQGAVNGCATGLHYLVSPPAAYGDCVPTNICGGTVDASVALDLSSHD